MKGYIFGIVCGMVILAGLLVPAASAIDPLWKEEVSIPGELSGIVISEDGSTIVAGGDKLIALTPEGRRLWTGWSGSHLAISRDGNYIVTSRDTTVRLISGTGTMLWDESLAVVISDVVIRPDASLIAAAGGTRVRLINQTGSGFRQNVSTPSTHIRFFPKGDMLVVTSKNGVQTSNLTLFSEWSDTNVSQEFVEVSGNGSSFVTVTNNRVRKYSRDGNLLWDRALPGGNALSFALSRDGSTIVVGRDDNTIEVLDGNGTHLWSFRAGYWVTSVAVSDDGNTIAAGCLDKKLLVFDRAGTNMGSATTTNPLKAGSVAVTGDGSLIAVVDASAVYGFSRSQFAQPAPVVTTEAVPSAVNTPVPVITYEITTVLPVPTTTATPAASLWPGTVLAGLFLLIVSRHEYP